VRVPTCYAVRRWGPGLPAVVDSVDHAKELAEYTNARAADVENMWVLNTHICGLGVAQSIMPVLGAFAGGTHGRGEGIRWETLPALADMSHAVARAIGCPSTPKGLKDPWAYCILSYTMARPEAMLRTKFRAWQFSARQYRASHGEDSSIISMVFEKWRAYKASDPNPSEHTDANTSSAALTPDAGFFPLDKHPDSISRHAAQVHTFLIEAARSSSGNTTV
jgi:hypothetical protein